MSESAVIKRCPHHPDQRQPCVMCETVGNGFVMTIPPKVSPARVIDTALANSLTYAFLEGRIKELESDKHRLQEHNSDLVLRRQSAEDRLREVMATLGDVRCKFESAMKNEHAVMLQLQSRIDAQNDHIRLLRNEVEMW